MAPLGRSLALLAALSLPATATATATAQVRGLPIVNSGIRNGGGVAADVGFGNDASGTGTTLGLTATTGMGFIGASASVSRGSNQGNSVWSQAVALSFRLLGGPMMPFRLTLQAGAGRWGEGVVETVRLPVSLGVAAVIPVPGVAIRPWLAPRLDYQSTTFENSDLSRTEFGLSGGLEVALLNGVTIRTAYDRLFIDGDPGILSVGVGMSLGR
jgi:hypothetical protein